MQIFNHYQRKCSVLGLFLKPQITKRSWSNQTSYALVLSSGCGGGVLDVHMTSHYQLTAEMTKNQETFTIEFLKA